MARSRLKVGDSVRYYDYVTGTSKIGTVTALDVPILWMGPRYPQKPLIGIQINGALTREYGAVAHE
jgi:hypothetical protein